MAGKRKHSEINKHMSSTASLVSETRKLIIPLHRVQIPNRQEQLRSVNINEMRDASFPGVKTSTPIDDNLTKKTEVPNKTWGNIPAYDSDASPCDVFPSDGKFEDNFISKTTLPEGLSTESSLQSIISTKISKYDYDNETDPSPNSMNIRRVTFSLSNHTSSTNSSPLDPVRAEKLNKDIENISHEDIEYDENCKQMVESSRDTTESSNFIESSDFIKTKDLIENKQTSVEDKGFFSRVTNIFCSAVHAIPSFAPWRILYNNQKINSKRVRSPDDQDVLKSPISKRPCYPGDLLLHPIKCRRPISKSNF